MRPEWKDVCSGKCGKRNYVRLTLFRELHTIMMVMTLLMGRLPQNTKDLGTCS